MSFEAWATFCLTELVLCITPGPAVLLVISVALRGGLRPGLLASSGVLAANALYFALSATSVAAVLLASRELFVALRWAGAAYLVWLGLRMLLAPARNPAGAPPGPPTRSFLRGLVVQGANPKALVFFVALLPQFIDPDGSVPFQILLLGASSIAIELLALGAYAVGSSRARVLVGPGATRALERVGGGVLVAAGARLAAVRAE